MLKLKKVVLHAGLFDCYDLIETIKFFESLRDQVPTEYENQVSVYFAAAEHDPDFCRTELEAYYYRPMTEQEVQEGAQLKAAQHARHIQRLEDELARTKARVGI